MVWMPAHTGRFLDFNFISALLGHSRSSFTDDTLVHLFPEVAKAAAESAAAAVAAGQEGHGMTAGGAHKVRTDARCGLRQIRPIPAHDHALDLLKRVLPAWSAHSRHAEKDTANAVHSRW